MHNYVRWWNLVTRMRIQVPLLLIDVQTQMYRHRSSLKASIETITTSQTVMIITPRQTAMLITTRQTVMVTTTWGVSTEHLQPQTDPPKM